MSAAAQAANDDLAPSGMVTFVFTDIEDHSALLRSLGDHYLALLDRHNSILRDCWRRFGGYEVGTGGDSFFVAFADRSAALHACVETQRLLHAEPWPNGATVRVRMGVHTGLASPRAGDYISLTVNQASRVVNAAHGGQILLTADALEGARLPTGVTTQPLGRFRVRDFETPITLFQVVDGAERHHHPPLRVPPYEQHNLARPLTTLIGRSAELSALRDLVQPGRLVSIVGPGGVGKTRLATELALDTARNFDDGAWLVELAPLAHAEAIPGALSNALGFAPARDADLDLSLRGFLRHKSMLLVLDNSEHLTTDVATLVTQLRQHCPALAVLVTGREPLGAPGEITFLLQPLSTMPTSAGVPDAVSLFLERSAEAGASRRTRSVDLERIRELCRRLDGLPLAIEMAAARAAAFSPEEILDALTIRARAHSEGDTRDAGRHRSLAELFAWSEVLLDDDERSLLHSLAAFADTFTVNGAAAVAADGVEVEFIPDLLWRLTTRSLVFADPQPDVTRFRLLETVRELLRRRIPQERQLDDTRRLGSWLVASLGPGAILDRAWSHHAAFELNNIRHVIEVLAEVDQPTSQRLACTVLQYHGRIVDNHEPGRNYRDGAKEGLRFLELLPHPSHDRVGLLVETAWLHQFLNDVATAQALLAEAALLRDQVGRPSWKPFYLERVAAELAAMTGDLEAAGRIVDAALLDATDPDSRGALLDIAAHVCFERGDFTGAAEYYQAEARLWAELRDEAKAACANGNLAEVLLTAGDVGGATRAQLRCLDAALRLGAQREVAYSLHLAARVATLDTAWTDAAAFVVVGDDQLARIGASMYPTDRLQADHVIASCRTQLGGGRFEEVTRLALGRDLGDVIAEAVAFLHRHP